MNLEHPVMGYQEVAELLTQRGNPMTRQNVYCLEQSALVKMRNHPAIRSLAEEMGILSTEGTDAGTESKEERAGGDS